MLQISASTKAVSQNYNYFTFDVSDRPSFSSSPWFVNEIPTHKFSSEQVATMLSTAENGETKGQHL